MSAAGARPWLGPALLALVPAAAFVVLEPRTADLAAHALRAELVERTGFGVWNGSWYGGHHTPAYSVLFPPLAALLGPPLAGALAAVAAAAAYGVLAAACWGRRGAASAWWFATGGTAALLFTGRLPFALGAALGLAALLALVRRRPVAAAALAAGTGLASPIAALFLALAGAALLVGAGRRAGAALAAAALAPPLAVALAFPEGGTHELPAEGLAAVLAMCAAFVVLLPRAERVLRAGALLYAAGAAAAFALPTPVGNNATRLGALMAGPLLLGALAAPRPRPGRARLPPLPAGGGRRALAGLALAGALAWQLSAPVRDTARALRDPAAAASYFAPLVEFLAGAAGPADRVEVPLTESRWEAAEVAPRFPLARGWQRQLDRARNPLFYAGRLTDRRWSAWLRLNAVRFVAVPDAALDPAGAGERALARRAPPYLAERLRTRHWRVFEVVPRPPAVVARRGAPLALRRLGLERVELAARGPGSAVVRVRWSPHWRAAGGCVERAGAWTRVEARAAGPLELRMAPSPGRMLAAGRRCG